MSEHDELGDDLEREADELARASDALGGHIEDARTDFAAKQHDFGVPGADPDDHVLAETDDAEAGEDEDEDEDEDKA